MRDKMLGYCLVVFGVLFAMMVVDLFKDLSHTKENVELIIKGEIK